MTIHTDFVLMTIGVVGLGNIFNITRQRLYELRVVMRDTYNNRWCAAYKMFKLDAPATGYRLRVGQYQEAPISNVGKLPSYIQIVQVCDNCMPNDSIPAYTELYASKLQHVQCADWM